MDDLSPRQRQVLELIMEATHHDGRVPSVRELATLLGVKAVGTIQDHLRALEEKGYLEREAGRSRNLRLTDRVPDSGKLTLPILGRIAAGRPIEAIESREELDVADDLQLEGCYLLQVRGTSMIEDQIADGDWVAVRPQTTARNGEIVVALLEGGEATLKRYYREADHIRLQPANSAMEPIRVREVQIQGRVVAVLRAVR